MTNNRQFNKMYKDLLRSGLNGNEIVALTVIEDRMNSSVTRSDFFDKKIGRHYVIYTREELSIDLSITLKTAGNIINNLVKKGYLTKKKQFSKADKLFIPTFNEQKALSELHERAEKTSMSVEFTPLEGKKLHSNQTDLNQTNTKQVNTVNTGNCENTQEDVQETNDSFDVFSWIDSTVRGFSMDRSIPEVVAKYSQYYENPKDFCYDTIGVISKVRASIAKKFSVDNSKKSQFDSNANFGSKLASKVRSVFVHAISKKITKAEDVMKYLNKSLQEFFTQATGNAMAIARPCYAPEMNAPIQAQKQSKNVKKHVEPEWLTDPEGYNKKYAKPVSPEKKARVEALLAKFNHDEEPEVASTDYDASPVSVEEKAEIESMLKQFD